MAQKYAHLDADRFVIGFYADDFHEPHQIPDGAVPITDAQHAQLLAGQSAGKRMSLCKRGKPKLVDRPAPTNDELASAARAQRNTLLADCDRIVARHRDQVDEGIKPSLSAAVYRAWLAYRRALRELPQQKGFPSKIDWPDAPKSS